MTRMIMPMLLHILLVVMVMYIVADIIVTFYVEGLSEPHVVTVLRRMAVDGDQKSMMAGATITAAGILAWFASKQYFA